MTFRIIQGDNRDTLKTLADNSVDAIVTDPPYGIDFLGKSWDANTGALETYQECLRVLKPGGHILAFSAARTYHHLAVTLEQAGFEIRDQIMWIYSSGFPKSQDIGKSIQRSLGVKKTKARTVNAPSYGGRGDHVTQNESKEVIITDPEAQAWAGWGTQLKPAHEPIALARKPLHKNNSIAKNCQQWGTGALNIDATRVPYEDQKDIDTYLNNKRGPMERGNDEDGENIRMFNGETGFKAVKREVTVEQDLPEQGRFPSNVIGEILQEDYQKYFYCPKVSRRERHVGFNSPDYSDVPQGDKTRPGGDICNESGGLNHDRARFIKDGNNHPTVKPVELMKYLIKLITPPGGTVLDPFNGSGSTGMAAVELDFDYIGCELDPAYVKIAETRIRAWANKDHATNNYGDLFEE
jgi:site-specific DNA-methyltransferase (adenine-specific)